MIIISNFILIMCKAINVLNINLSSILFTRLTAIILLYASILSYNSLYIQCIGSGIGIFNGFFHITTITQFTEIFIYIIAACILVSWPSISNTGSYFALSISNSKTSRLNREDLWNNLTKIFKSNYNKNISKKESSYTILENKNSIYLSYNHNLEEPKAPWYINEKIYDLWCKSVNTANVTEYEEDTLKRLEHYFGTVPLVSDYEPWLGNKVQIPSISNDTFIKLIYIKSPKDITSRLKYLSKPYYDKFTPMSTATQKNIEAYIDSIQNPYPVLRKLKPVLAPEYLSVDPIWTPKLREDMVPYDSTIKLLSDNNLFMNTTKNSISNADLSKNTEYKENYDKQITESFIRNNDVNIQYATDYSLLILFSILGSSLLISSYDFISMYLSIELQSFGLYILSTLYKNSKSSTSAGLKYFLLGGLASCIILLGSALIYSNTGITNFDSLYSLISVKADLFSYAIIGIVLGFIFIIIGFIFKIAAAPLHFWAPDVYDDTPTVVTTWLIIMPKIAILIFLLEIVTQLGYMGTSIPIVLYSLPNTFDTINIDNLITNIIPTMILDNNAFMNFYIPYLNSNFFLNTNIEGLELLPHISYLEEYLKLNSQSYFNNLLLISSLLSLIIGNIVGLSQTHIKRLLAYSTISHVGFLLLALAINTEQSIDSFLFYILQYSLTNLNIFLILIAYSYIISEKQIIDIDKINITDIKLISQLKGQFYNNPLLFISLSICFFSLAGIPPLIGFFAKQSVLYSAIQNENYFMCIIGILVSVISASYYLKVIKLIYNSDIYKDGQVEKFTLVQWIAYNKDKKELIKYKIAWNCNYLLSKLISKKEPLKLAQRDWHLRKWFAYVNYTDHKDYIMSYENWMRNVLNKIVISNFNYCSAVDNNTNINSNSNIHLNSMNSTLYNSTLTSFHSYLISIFTFLIIFFILKTSLILNSTQLLSLTIFNY